MDITPSLIKAKYKYKLGKYRSHELTYDGRYTRGNRKKTIRIKEVVE